LTDAQARPRPLVWAVNVIVLQTAMELAYVAGRSELTIGLRLGLMVVVAMQFPRRSPPVAGPLQATYRRLFPPDQ